MFKVKATQCIQKHYSGAGHIIAPTHLSHLQRVESSQAFNVFYDVAMFHLQNDETLLRLAKETSILPLVTKTYSLTVTNFEALKQ